MTIGEVQAGVEITREQDEAKVKELEAWLEKVSASFGALPMNASAFQERVQFMHRKSDMLAEDAMITATASVHSLTMATRNVGDFGRALQNPFERKQAIAERVAEVGILGNTDMNLVVRSGPRLKPAGLNRGLCR